MSSLRRCQVQVAAGTPPKDAHVQLWLDRFVQLDDDEKAAKAKQQVIEDAIELTSAAYSGAVEEREALLRTWRGDFGEEGWTRLIELRTTSDLIVGLGVAAVRETNLSLHHTWGRPLIPGSALKGLAAAAARRTGNDRWRPGDAETPTDYDLLFGTTDRAGLVVFHDAWAKANATLHLDVMTPHHQRYYGGEDEPPADSDSPVPVPFAVVRGDFQGALTGPGAWVDRAMELLALGLESLGVGAKTAAGYGRMALVPVKTEEERKEEERQRRRAAWREKAKTWFGKLKLNQLDRKAVSGRFLELCSEADVDLDRAREIARALYEADRDRWKTYLASQPENRRAELARFGLPPEGEGIGMTTALTRVEGLAWSAGKGRCMLQWGGKPPEPTKFKKVGLKKGKQELRAAIEGATEENPLRVWIEIDEEQTPKDVDWYTP